MSSYLSNVATLSIPSLPSPNCKANPTNHGVCCIAVKSMGGDQVRENLDHLQRSSKQQQQQLSQPTKRMFSQSSSPLGLWDRFPTARTVQQMMDTMERIMEDPFAYRAAPFAPLGVDQEGVITGNTNYRRGRTPWEIKEGESDYKMRFDVPGMTKRDVKVWVEEAEKMLIIKAEKLPPVRGEGEEGREEEEWSAWSFGKYSNRIALPDNVVAEKIKAEVKDGVLYITIPKASPSAAKVLEVDVQ